jgi:hypothetical protein
MEAASPFFGKVKNAIMQNFLVRSTVISFYALWHYETGFLSILMFVVATFLGNFVGV